MIEKPMGFPSILNLYDRPLNDDAEFKYRIDLSYIGQSFQGWQSQPSRNTIQDNLEHALGILTKKSIRVVGASRTDTGVHAEHQVACFQTNQPLEEPKFTRSLQALVHKDIGIYNVQKVDLSFHPIYSAHAKLYRYRIWIGSGMSPFLRPYAWKCHQLSFCDQMICDSKDLVGHHNFKSFCASDSSVEDFNRKIFDIKWVLKKNYIEFYILGEGFLKQMVRSIIGTLVEIGRGQRRSNSMREIISAEDRVRAGITAPSHGLSLVKVFYEPTNTIPASIDSKSGNFGFSLGLIDF